MIDGGAASELGAGEGEGAGGGGGDGGGGGGGSGSDNAPEWLGGLPDDLRADATLSRYKDVEALARGHLETKKVASSKLAVPAADAPPEAWDPVWSALGRPADPKEYELALPEGQEASPVADAFRPIAHKLGLNNGQAKALSEFWNEQIGQMQTAWSEAGQREVDTLKQAMGDQYEARLAKAQAAFKALGGDPEIADQLDARLGSGQLLKFMMNLGERMGEHSRVDGDSEGLGADLANAADQIKALHRDKGFMEKFNAGDAEATAKYERLRNAARKQGRA